jgi:diadenosine tetraphosphate (Ap4A) HIT family hydrolase
MPELHPQLLADCHLLGETPGGTLLLARNAALHWLILVPDSREQDLLDLPPVTLQQVLAECQRLAAYLKQALGYPKVNFAALGHVVPQLHLHLVGRRENDPCWPQPVWGNLPAGPAWSETELEGLRRALTGSQ